MATVHLIDTDPVSVFIASEVMAQHSHALYCVVSASGADAVAAIHELAAQGRPLPDLVLLDIHLPDIQKGWAVLDALSETLPAVDLPVVILTSFVSPRDWDRAARYPNVLGLFQKPLSRNLLNEIFGLLQRQAPCPGSYAEQLGGTTG